MTPEKKKYGKTGWPKKEREAENNVHGRDRGRPEDKFTFQFYLLAFVINTSTQSVQMFIYDFY